MDPIELDRQERRLRAAVARAEQAAQRRPCADTRRAAAAVRRDHRLAQARRHVAAVVALVDVDDRAEMAELLVSA